MQIIRFAKVDGREIPVVISDEREALLAAKAAGRAIIGLWRDPQAAGTGLPEDKISVGERQEDGISEPALRTGAGSENVHGMNDVGIASYAVLSADDIDAGFLERVARRHLGLPWNICETERLLIREITRDDYAEILANRVGRGLETCEELESYVKHQYSFCEFGMWALEEKKSGRLIGVAGVTQPQEEEESAADGAVFLVREVGAGEADACPDAFSLELGYSIFPPFRRRGYARESCLAVMEYAGEELGATEFLVRIHRSNAPSLALARSLGFREKEFQ